MTRSVLVGFEVGSGAPVEVPVAHTFVTGQTQLSGKTTALQALVVRSGRRALAFRTKRGEQLAGAVVPPFLPREGSEPIHWRLVETILASALGQRSMKYERLQLIDAVNKPTPATSLQGVRDNVVTLLAKTKGRGDIYTLIREYLDLVLPDMQRLGASHELKLATGLSVMSLDDIGQQLQALVIRAALQRINQREHNVLVVFPEAWEFAPRGRMSPAKDEAIALARKGAAVGNFLLCDSQDIAGVDPVLRQAASVWLLGVQRELNELGRSLRMIEGVKKPKASEVSLLGLGEFFVCWSKHALHTYVQPTWMTEAEAQAIARREATIGDVRSGDPRRLQEAGLAPARAVAVARDASALGAVATDQVTVFVARGQRAQAVADHLGYHGAGLTFDELGIGEHFWWAAPTPRGPEAMVKTSGTGYRWSKGVGTAEPYYRVERFDEAAGGEGGWWMSERAERMLGEVVTALQAQGASIDRLVQSLGKPGAIPASASRPMNGESLRDMPALDRAALITEITERVVQQLGTEGLLIKVDRSVPSLEVNVARPVLTPEEGSVQGLLALLISEGWFERKRTVGEIQTELRGRGFGAPAPNISRAISDLARMGFFTLANKWITLTAGAAARVRVNER